MSAKIKIISRIFVEADAEKAQAIASRLKQTFADIVEETSIEDYWKEPGWKEITLEIDAPTQVPQQALETIANKLGTGWTFGSEDATAFAVWNHGGDGTFNEQAVRFANLEVVSE